MIRRRRTPPIRSSAPFAVRRPTVAVAFAGALAAAATLAGCGDGDGDGDPASGAAAPRAAAEASLGAADEPAPWFAAATDAGLDFEHVSGEDGTYRIMTSLGAGAAFADVDGDDDLDVYLVQSGSWTDPASRGPNRLFLNAGDGRFTDVTETSGAGDRGYGMGVAAADYDADGDVDLFVTNVGPDVLLRNRGDGTFEDVTAAAGVAGDAFSTGAAWFDADGDGDLDLWVVTYLHWDESFDARACFNRTGGRDYCVPTAFDAASPDTLWRNEGDGTFTDVSAAAGIADVRGTGLGIRVADFDGDDRPDVFVANDAMRDRLWVNQGEGRFAETGLAAGVATDAEGRTTASMGVTARDVDDDGDLDLLVCNISGETDSFFRNEGGLFVDVTNLVGLGTVSRPFTRFGQGWADFDHDGRVDLFQANGRVSRKDGDGDGSVDPYAEPDLLFRGTESGRWVEVRPRGGTAEPIVATSRAAVFGDVDGDGDLDVLVTRRDGAPHLLLNVAAKRGESLVLDLREADGRLATGTSVRLTVGTGRRLIEASPAYSYLASNDPRIHVGLGDAGLAADIVVRWADGTREDFGDRSGGDGPVRLVRGTGRRLD